MKSTMLLIAMVVLLLVISGAAEAKNVYVKGHVTKKGKYIHPHVSTSPDKTRLNNFSTKGNVNPYTGKAGTKNPVGQ